MDVKNKQKNQAKSSIHGNSYQNKLLMLFLFRGVSHEYYSFRLGTEIEEAGKFDDLVFEYTQNGKKVYRLLQAKHKLGEETKKITAHSLLEERNGDYNLTKYCNSYISSKENDLFKNGLIKDVIVCTNINFDFENLKRKKIPVEMIEDIDDILDVVGGKKQPQRYRFGQELAALIKTDECSVDEVKDFLDHLVFAVNQPNEEELGMIIKKELGEKFNFDIKTEKDVYNNFFVTMFDWFKGKGSNRYFSSEEGKKFFEEAERGIPVWFGVRDPVASFVGRDKQLDNLHEMLQSGDKAVISQSVSISGLGGIGKSELARMYINKYSVVYDNKIIWINAEKYQTLAESFRRLACDQLGMPTKNPNGKEMEMKSIVEKVYNFFSYGKSLFVFDNAEKYRSREEFDCGINTFLLYGSPCNKNRPHILITSRNQNWPKSINTLNLDVLTEEEAVQFIKNSLSIQSDAQDREIKDLSKELQYFPLALQQAVSYLRVQDEKMKNVGSVFKVSNYLEKFREKTKELLDFQFPEDSDNEYTKTTYITWNVTLDAIRQKEDGEDALKILNIISYFSPENIPVEILLNLAHDEEKLGSSIELLKQYSMVNSESGMLNIHRLVQHVTRIKLDNQKKEEDILSNVLELFNKGNLSSRTVDHAIVALNYSRKYTRLIETFLPVSCCIIIVLINSDRSREAYMFALEVLELLKAIPLVHLLETNGDVIDIIISGEGNALLNLAEYDKALNIFQSVLNILDYLEPICESDVFLNIFIPKVLKFKAYKARAISFKGQYDEALILYQEIKTTQQELWGKDHPDILPTERNIANMFLAQGKYVKGLQILEKVYNIQIKTLGENHSQSFETKMRIGTAHLALFNCDEALLIFQEVLNFHEASLETNLLDISNIKQNIATVLSRQGKYNDAFWMYQDLLTMKRERLGEEHPYVLYIRYRMAQILRLQGKYEEALEAFKEIFELTKNIFGHDHRYTLNAQYYYAYMLQTQGKHTEALQIYEEILEKRKDISEYDHVETLYVRTEIAYIISLQGSHDKALQMYQEIFAVQERVLGLNHFDSLNTKKNMGKVLYYKKEYDEALKFFWEVFNTLQKISPNHPANSCVKDDIARVFSSQGKYAEALKIFRELLAFQEANLESNPLEKSQTKHCIANALLDQEKKYEALEVYEEVLDGYNKFLGPENDQTLEISNAIQSLIKLPKILITTVNNNDFNKLKKRIERGGNVNSKDNNGYTLLHHAVNPGNSDMVQFLLENGADVNQITKKGNTPLHIATLRGFLEIVEILLQHASHNKLNEFVNAKTTLLGKTSLHVAVKKGILEIIMSLLKHGAIYDIKNKEDKTPLDFSNNHNVTKLLKLTAELFEDVANDNDCIMKKLEELEPEQFEAVKNVRNNEGHTLLEVATINKKNIQRKLLEILNTPE